MWLFSSKVNEHSNFFVFLFLNFLLFSKIYFVSKFSSLIFGAWKERKSVGEDFCPVNQLFFALGFIGSRERFYPAERNRRNPPQRIRLHSVTFQVLRTRHLPLEADGGRRIPRSVPRNFAGNFAVRGKDTNCSDSHISPHQGDGYFQSAGNDGKCGGSAVHVRFFS